MSDQPRIAVVGSTMIGLIGYSHRIPTPSDTIQGDTLRPGFSR